MTVGSKKYLNKSKTEVRKALGIGYKFISNLGKEMKHKNMNWRGKEGAGSSAILKSKAVPPPASNFQSQQ